MSSSYDGLWWEQTSSLFNFSLFLSVLMLHVFPPWRGVSLAEFYSASLEPKASLGDFSSALKVQCHLAQPDPKFSLGMYSPHMWVWCRIHSRCSLQDENYPHQSQPCISCGRALCDSRQVAALPISHPLTGFLSMHLHAEAVLFTQFLALWPYFYQRQQQYTLPPKKI